MTRRQYSARFKARVAMEAMRGSKPMNELAKRLGLLRRRSRNGRSRRWRDCRRFLRTIAGGRERARRQRPRSTSRSGGCRWRSSGLKKSTDWPIDERRRWIDPGDPELSVRRQCELLGVARSGLYYRPGEEREENLALMRLLDEQYTRTPYYGVRRMTAWLRRGGWEVNPKRIRRLLRQMGLRYEFLTKPQEARGRRSALRDVLHDAQFTLGPPMKNPSLRNISPRFGFAWDVMGDGKTAVRGGFAMLYDVGNFGTTFLMGATGSPPFSSVSAVNSPPLITIPFFFPKESLGKSIRGPEYNMQQPHILHYNLTVDRQLPFDMGLTVAYAGSRGMNLLRQTEGNPTVPQIRDGRPFWTGKDPRANPNWGSFSMQRADGNSWYNALLVSLTKRLGHGLQFQSSYTWSKLIDETQGQAPADNGGRTTLSSDRSVDRGPAEFDLRHNWRFNTIYRLPDLASGKRVGKVLNGWWVSGILALRSGYPITPSLSNNRSRSDEQIGGADRPNLAPGVTSADLNKDVSRGCGTIPAGTPLKTPQMWFDPCNFAVQPIGFLRNAGRGIVRGPSLANLDFSLAKDTALGFLGESGKLEFRAEFFNILNHANFGLPSEQVLAGTAEGEAPLSNAGRINVPANDSRRIQLSLKLLF